MRYEASRGWSLGGCNAGGLAWEPHVNVVHVVSTHAQAAGRKVIQHWHSEANHVHPSVEEAPQAALTPIRREFACQDTAHRLLRQYVDAQAQRVVIAEQVVSKRGRCPAAELDCRLPALYWRNGFAGFPEMNL